MHPNIHISFLRQLNRATQFRDNYLNVFSITPKFSYALVSNEKFKLAPYAGPFVSRIVGLKTNELLLAYANTNLTKWGLEWGLRMDVTIGKVTFRLIPYSSQRSIEDFYRQSMVSLLVKI